MSVTVSAVMPCFALVEPEAQMFLSDPSLVYEGIDNNLFYYAFHSSM